MQIIKIICLLTFVFLGTPALCDDFSRLKGQNQFLEAELKLSKKPNIYVVFDLSQKKVYLKARGEVFKEMDIKGIRFWGSHTAPMPVQLIKRNTFFKPKRDKIKPGSPDEEEEDTFEIEALELEDMPTAYSLSLSDGISISVKPDAQGFLLSLFSPVRTLRWYVSRPILTVWNALRRRNFTSIELTLGEKDAQSLYWSFHEGAKGIVYYPQD